MIRKTVLNNKVHGEYKGKTLCGLKPGISYTHHNITCKACEDLILAVCAFVKAVA